MASASSKISSGSSASSIRGFGGLASGLDRDSLIEGMTIGTRSKIAKQQKSKQTLQWKQDTYRSISSKLIEFSKKYTSYSSVDTNLLSTAFWTKSAATPTGVNSKYVQVTGSPNSSGNISIVGVEKLAKRASVTSGSVSGGALNTGVINFEDVKTISNLEGQTLNFQVGTETFAVELKSGEVGGFTYDYSNATKAMASIKEALKGISIGDKTLDQVIQVTASPAGDENTPSGTPFELDFTSIDPDNREISLTGGSEGALKALGFEDSSAFVALKITDSGTEGIDGLTQKAFSQLSFKDRIDGKKMTFSYNGTSKTIDLKYDDTWGIGDRLQNFAQDIQTKLEDVFGKGRISVTTDNGKLKFVTQTPNGGTDSTSELTVTSADSGIVELLGVKTGQSNRLNWDAAVKDSGLVIPADGKIKINGKEITIDPDWTMNELIETINNETDVTVTYMKNTDQFSIISKQEGASGKVTLDQAAADLFNAAAGTVDGQDAIISVRYGDSTDPVKLSRGSNTFDLDGMKVTVNGTFNTDGNDATQEVALNTKADPDKIVKAVSSMVKDYNELIKLINDEVSTRPNRKYEPLTDEQKEEMTEKQIEKWETEAKKGMLFGDPELRSLSDSMRFIFGTGGDEIVLMQSFGITKSTDYGENGALSFDETKFRKALEETPDKVQELFNKAADKDTGDRGGFMARLSEVNKQYAATTGSVKGSLIEKAGSIHSPASILSNTLKKSMDRIDDYVERLQAQLKVETDRYVKQFTSLETLISQMNSQSSWLQGAFGG
ncbi:MAG: flagellar filament capping protein FliD [Lacrimispora sp.]|uniref:flagellar filament capping protein FliD n=1 Tax=Lacrimispora sp. TaxID=2719234 RepID=UPI0039E4FD35